MSVRPQYPCPWSDQQVTLSSLLARIVRITPLVGENAPANGVSDDGPPTDRPVPGYPLMRHGKVLVNPNGYECHKCE